MTISVALFAQDEGSKALFDRLATALIAIGFSANAIQCPDTEDGLVLSAFVSERLSFGGFSIVPITGRDNTADAGAATLGRVVKKNRAAVLLCPNGLVRWRSFLVKPEYPSLNWRIPLVFQLTANHSDYAGLEALVPSIRTLVVPGLEWPSHVIETATEMIRVAATEPLKSW